MRLESCLFLLGAVVLQLIQGKVTNKCIQHGMYAMTWDDIPTDQNMQLLDILEQKNVQATFHIITQHLTDPLRRTVIERLTGAGHLIGLRIETSVDLFKMTDLQIRTCVAHHANVFASILGYFPKFFRLPSHGHGHDERVLAAVESTGLIVTSHSPNTLDDTVDDGHILNTVPRTLALAESGRQSIISLQTVGPSHSVERLGPVIDHILEYGYQMVKLDECLGLGDMTRNREPLEGVEEPEDWQLDGASFPRAAPGTVDSNDQSAKDAFIAGQAPNTDRIWVRGKVPTTKHE